ncbi:MAG: IS66 family insertion sequence element accessory protein TnpA [Planctomycetales bacterium]
MSLGVFLRESTSWQRRYSLEQWTKWIAEQAGSWLTIAAFCGSIRVSENSFSVWHRKLVSRSRAESRTGKVGRAASTKRLSSSFVPHSIAVSSPASSGVQLGLPYFAVVLVCRATKSNRKFPQKRITCDHRR